MTLSPRFGLEFGYFIPGCGSDLPDLRPTVVRVRGVWSPGQAFVDIHYLHYGALLFLVTSLVTIGKKEPNQQAA